MTSTVGVETEPLEDFRRRARTFVRSELRPLGPGDGRRAVRGATSDEEELAAVAHERELQRAFFDAGLAGICIPVEYGGQGLTPAHQQALNEELAGYEHPARIQVPTMSPCAAVLLECGTEEQKRRHLPAILRGEEIWVQLLSEPSGGSDVAGALTSAVRDGDVWVLNGSKIWTTGAWWSDWGLCLARTNWDVPKHRGLTVFILPLHQPGIEIHRIEMINGSKEFCQEFLTDVVVPDSDRVSPVDEGWTVGLRWMFYERMLTNSPYVTMPAGTRVGQVGPSAATVAVAAGRADDPCAAELVGEARMLELVGEALERRLRTAIHLGLLGEQASAIGRLFAGTSTARRTTVAFELAAAAAVASDDGPLAEVGADFLMRQASCIGGGTTEMARNVIAERVLGMPREPAADRDVPFRDVPRGGQRR